MPIVDGWCYRGRRAVVLDHPGFLAVFLPELGGLIWKIIHKRTWKNILYNHRDPSIYGAMQTSHPQRDPIHDYFVGGWFEALPNAGYPYLEGGGPMFDFHGETPYLPWQYSVQGDALSMWVTLLRSPLKLERRITLTERGFRMDETLTNLGRTDFVYSWLHHPCFDLKTLSGSKLTLEVEELEVDATFQSKYRKIRPGYTGRWPIVESVEGAQLDLSTIQYNPHENTSDTVYLKIKKGYFRIENSELKLGITVNWDHRVFPYTWYWLTNGGGEYPWYGTAHTFSLEISTSYPSGLANQIKKGTARKIHPGETLNTFIQVDLTDT